MALGRSWAPLGRFGAALGAPGLVLGEPRGGPGRKWFAPGTLRGVPRNRVPTQGGSRGALDSANERFGAVVVFPEALES